MTDLDRIFHGVATGGVEEFAQWVGRVERPIRASLARFARAVDVEGVVQETLLRMWRKARDPGPALEGENASLRFAIGMARNIARNEARRHRREHLLPPEDMPDAPVDPERVTDHGLQAILRECLALLRGQPRRALLGRIEHGGAAPDSEVAELVGMTLNTLLQNIVRARQQVLECLVRKGVPREELGL